MDGRGTISALSFQLRAATPGEGLGSYWLPLSNLPLSPVYSRETAGILSLDIKRGQAALPAPKSCILGSEINSSHQSPAPELPCSAGNTNKTLPFGFSCSAKRRIPA